MTTGSAKPPYPAFFSYGHARGGQYILNPNEAYFRFFRDICSKLYHLTVFEGDVAFTDTSLHIGDPFPDMLYEQLAQFQVFVPVISLNYFERPWCGREWAAFEKRCEDHVGAPFPPIVPILWNASADIDFPDWFEDKYLYDDATLDPRYRTHGMFGLQSAYRKAYATTVYELAVRISQVAKTARLPACDPEDLRNLPPRFGGDA